jgi:UDP-2,3-diacylglucosamine hydrolase
VTTLFVSDLHLEAARPEIGRQFLAFLQEEAVSGEALYILGDLFESWIGDDDPNLHYAEMKSAIRAVADAGVPVFFMHGNRDFLIGPRFAEETGVVLLEDPCPVRLYGEDVLLSHGDALCIDDVKYQEVRTVTRNPGWQAMMLKKPLAERQAIARQARADSMAHGGSLDPQISDVSQAAVEQLLRRHGVRTLLHGHTHRPAVHRFLLDGTSATRIVLGDWYQQGSVLRWDRGGPQLTVLERDRARSPDFE